MKDLLNASVFSGVPSWKDVSFLKEITPKVLKFEVTSEGSGPRLLYLAAIISREEKMAWQSFQDVLEHTMTFAQVSLRGFFGFDVVTVDIRDGIRNFDPKALGQLIVNHARTLGPDQKALIRYGQLFALLHYRAPAEWGKVEVKTHVEFFSQASASPEVSEASVRAALMGTGSKTKNTAGDQLDLLFKKLLNESDKEPDVFYMVHDLSSRSSWDPANAVQQERLRAWIEKEKQARGGAFPEFYFCHGATKTRVGA